MAAPLRQSWARRRPSVFSATRELLSGQSYAAPGTLDLRQLQSAANSATSAVGSTGKGFIMRSEVTVSFEGVAPVQIHLDNLPAMAPADARAWLDGQFKAMGCEPPVRPTGKVLSADKVMVVAEAAGPSKFADGAWAQEFGRAVSAMLNKPVVHVDVAAMTVSF
jgi:hypothetical protein